MTQKCNMTRSGSDKRNFKKNKNVEHKNLGEGALLNGDLGVSQKHFDIFIFFLLLGFGVYQSVLYFGHQQVPHFDFRCFTIVGHELLSFQAPSGFKRAPLLGILQVLLGHIAGGVSPDFRGGLLLNAMLHPLNAVLLWLVGRRIVGRAAFWIAVIAIINPWVLQLHTEAIAETTLMFCFLITLYFIFKGSNWSYVFASITTMVRYEGAALIFIAFVLDMIRRKSKKERILAFVYSAVASVPLGIWMLGTFINWKGDVHYLAEMGDYSGGKIILGEFIQLTWQVGFYHLFMPLPTAAKDSVEPLFILSKILVSVSFIFGVLYGLYKKKWNILALLVFLFLYLFVHAVHGVQLHRYCMPVAWIPFLICFYGLYSCWKLINKNNRVPRGVVVALQIIVLAAAAGWIVMLFPYLPKMGDMSRRSVSLPYAAIGVVCFFVGAGTFIFKGKYLWRDIVAASVVILVIVSNQFMIAPVVGNGERDIEFKYLVNWYIANAKPGEKLVCTVPVILETLAPEYKDNFIHTAHIDANSPFEFVEECYKQGITYVAWDSRMGIHPNDRYYGFWKMKNIAHLAVPQNQGPYEFITQVGKSRRRFVNIFRLHRPVEKPKPGVKP